MMNQGFTNTTSWRDRTFLTNVALIVTIKTNNIRAFTRDMRLYSWHSGAALVETNLKATSDESSKKSPQLINFRIERLPETDPFHPLGSTCVTN